MGRAGCSPLSAQVSARARQGLKAFGSLSDVCDQSLSDGVRRRGGRRLARGGGVAAGQPGAAAWAPRAGVSTSGPQGRRLAPQPRPRQIISGLRRLETPRAVASCLSREAGLLCAVRLQTGLGECVLTPPRTGAVPLWPGPLKALAEGNRQDEPCEHLLGISEQAVWFH